MPTIGFYFPAAMTKGAVNALRSRLNKIAAGFGYTASAGPTTGQGNLAEMLTALDAGELVITLLPPEQRRWLLEWIEEQIPAMPQGNFRDIGIVEALETIAQSIQAANVRQADADESQANA